ncbi:MAG: hypothetical protein HYW78_02620 [Parcubacteria group bacterium]|nr:hypothetical protein [Parcubacteria group bacterium]
MKWPIVGREKIISFFEKAIANDTLHHAYLLYGPRYTEKELFAQYCAINILSKEMVAQPRFVANVRERERDEEQRRSGNSANVTARRSDEVVAALSDIQQKSGLGNHLYESYERVERMVLAGIYPEVIVIKREENKKNISIEQMRDCKTACYQKPLYGKKKIFIIEDADSISLEGINNLLKILEEAPLYCVLFLLARSLQRIPKTVRSRAQIIRFSYPLPPHNQQKSKDYIFDTLSFLPELRDRFEKNKEDREKIQLFYNDFSLLFSKNVQHYSAAERLYGSFQKDKELFLIAGEMALHAHMRALQTPSYQLSVLTKEFLQFYTYIEGNANSLLLWRNFVSLL